MRVPPRSVVLSGAGGEIRFVSHAADPSGTDWIVEDVTGWFGGVGVRGETADRLGHGEHVQRAWRAGRVLTLKGNVIGVDPAARDDIQRELSGVMWDGDFGTLTCEVGDLSLSTAVRLDGEISVGELGIQGVPVSIPLRAQTPWLYAPTQTVSVASSGTGIGLVYPLYSPSGVVSYGAESASTVGTLTNRGNAEAWPVYRPRGVMPTGWRIVQDGHVIEWSGSVVDGMPLVVDTARGVVESGGGDVSPLLAADDFRPVPPGTSASVTFEPLGGGTGFLEASIASTYI